MDNSNVAEVTSLQSGSGSAIYLKFGRSPEKVTACISPLSLHAFSEVWLKLDENCGSSSLLKMLTSEILQSAPNGPKLNSKNLT